MPAGDVFPAGPGPLSLSCLISSVLVHPLPSLSVVLYHITGLLPFTLLSNCCDTQNYGPLTYFSFIS